MILRRPYRRVVALAAMVCLVFAQSAAAAYGCPRPASDDRAVPVAAATCAHHVAGDADSAPDPTPAANLCEVHCQTGSLPDTGPVDAPVPVLFPAWILPQAAVLVPAAVLVAAVAPPGGSPPPLSRYCRLLI